MRQGGEMIEISALPGSVTKVMHLHYNDWPLLVTFCCNVNKLFCLLFVQSGSSTSACACLWYNLIQWISFPYGASALPSLNSSSQRRLIAAKPTIYVHLVATVLATTAHLYPWDSKISSEMIIMNDNKLLNSTFKAEFTKRFDRQTKAGNSGRHYYKLILHSRAKCEKVSSKEKFKHFIS